MVYESSTVAPQIERGVFRFVDVEMREPKLGARLR
jgi:hypothetical protein